jgi:hypothetical protein
MESRAQDYCKAAWDLIAQLFIKFIRQLLGRHIIGQKAESGRCPV